METKLTLKPGKRGTKKLLRKYGKRLVCVRYRYDEETEMRYKTIELIIDAHPWPGNTHSNDDTEMISDTGTKARNQK